jgi:hypothetical protein
MNISASGILGAICVSNLDGIRTIDLELIGIDQTRFSIVKTRVQINGVHESSWDNEGSSYDAESFMNTMRGTEHRYGTLVLW